ncbi:transcription factor Opi1-domain-containing protein [Lactifluus subvellereus]|nr:transcription factor Opi1-domain-containing protein [Lactifluus subvellereus]
MTAATQLEPTPQRSIQDEDESVRIAVRALGDMRNGALLQPPAAQPPCISSFQSTPVLSISSSSNSPTLTSPTLASDEPDMDAEEADFVARVSTFPVVSSALRAYEQSKASSRVVKYGAEMMECSVKSISRPVIDRLPVTSLDEFACRQLDRLGRYGAGTRRRPSVDADGRSVSRERQRKRGRSSLESALQIYDVNMRDLAERDPSPESERNVLAENPDEQQVVQRSRWQAVLLEAGGIGAAVSEESMRRLKYCLQWLQYATTHIDGQILILRDFIASLQPPPDSPLALNPDALISQERMRQLANVKRDVVATVRQVVDVVSKYAGGALPEPARTRVRGFILHLHKPGQAPHVGKTSHLHPSPLVDVVQLGEVHDERTQMGQGRHHVLHHPLAHPTHAISAKQAAQRILALATESLDMMRGVTGVVKDSLDRADAWVERLRVIGLQRSAATGPDTISGDAMPSLDLMAHRSPVGAGESATTSAVGTPVSVHAMLPSLSPIVRPATTLSSSSSSSLQDTFFADHHTAGLGRLSLSGSSPSTPNKKDMFTEEGERGSTPKLGTSTHDGSPAMEVDE